MKVKTFDQFLEKQKKDKRFKEAFEHYRNCFTIGLKIKSLRKNIGWTQKDLASALKVSQQVVSRWERGDMTNPTLETLEKIAEVTGHKLHIQFESA